MTPQKIQASALENPHGRGRKRSARLSSQRIYSLRHGLAGQRSKWHGNDADRPLSERGRTQVRHVSRALQRAGVQPDRIVTSPLPCP